MENQARRHIQRAVRYIIQPDDEPHLKYSPEKSHDILSAQLINISTTGLALLTTPDLAPNLGERIKLEFKVPEGKPVAWWGMVVRKEQKFQHIPWRRDIELKPEIVVGVAFYHMPFGHREEIGLAIQKKSSQLRRRNLINSIRQVPEFFAEIPYFFKKYKLVFLAIAFCALYLVGYLTFFKNKIINSNPSHVKREKLITNDQINSLGIQFWAPEKKSN